jgi:predicted DNA-binding transcriptional regulator YafY
MRVFRLDRVRSAGFSAEKFTRPADFDSKAFIFESLAHLPGTFTCEVLFDAPLELTREVIPASLGFLESAGDQTLLRCYTDSPAWLARYLMRFDLRFTVRAPDELRAALRDLADEIQSAVG